MGLMAFNYITQKGNLAREDGSDAAHFRGTQAAMLSLGMTLDEVG